jgi:spermidine synthase
VSVRRVAPLYLASGGVALGCETVWHRCLTLLLGASQPATGVVLAVFMAGLGLGAWWGGRWADRLVRPGRAYAAAELVVAASAVLIPRLWPALQDHAASTGLGGRALLAAAMLGPATVAMGVTLPALTALVASSRADAERQVARLTALNLAGAILGPLAVGYVGIPRWGVTATSTGLGAVALGVACVAWWLPPPGEPAAVQTSATPVVQHPRVLAMAFAVGALSFALQLVWNRALSLQLGASAYTFATVAASVLAGLASGGLRAALRTSAADAEGWWAQVAGHLIGLAVTVWLGVVCLHAAPSFFADAVRAGRPLWPLRLVLLGLVVGPPMYHVGAMFPRFAGGAPASRPGAAAALASLAATLGNAAGALGAGFVLVPWLGLQDATLSVAGAALVLSLFAALGAGQTRLRGIALSAAAAAFFAQVATPRWDHASRAAGTFRVAAYRERLRASPTAPCGPGRRLPARTLLFHRDGALGSVVVLGHPSGPDCTLYALRVDGKAEGSVFVRGPLRRGGPGADPRHPVGDLPTQVLSGILPALAGDRPARAFLVGWGTGLSAEALLAAAPRGVTAVELEPAVLSAAALFAPAPLRDPRVTLVVDDARMALRRAPPGAFEVIASHPSNPWISGASSLFSAEYFALARSRLARGGRMLAWVQLYETDRGAVRSVVAAYLRAFPETWALRSHPAARELLLLGFAGDAPSDADALVARVGRRMDDASRRALADAGVLTLDDLRARVVAGPGELARFARGVEAHREDRPVAEFRIADRMLAGTGDGPAEALAGL